MTLNRRLFLMGLPGLLGCTGSRRPRLNVFNWSSYIAPDTISGFELEFGVKVRYAVYESNEEMLAKTMSGNSGWDVVFPSNHYIEPMTGYGLLAPLRHEWLRNLGELDTLFQAPPWDPRLRHSVPYMWGSTGIIHRRELKPAPVAWADLWSARVKGRLTMLDDPSDVFGACLKKLGYSVNSSSPAELGEAKRAAVEQKRLVRAYVNAEVRDQLVAGDVLCAQLWATTSQQAIDESPDLAYVHPAEGFGLYADSAVVLRESSRQRLGHEFIDYLLRPKVAASIADASRTATVNRGARNLLPARTRESAVLYPPPDVLARGEWFTAQPPAAQRLRDRLWTEIRTA